METIGDRVRAAIHAARIQQKDVASAVGMTTDGLSRALSGKRGFAAIELAAIARLVDADLHFLITGEPDPHGFVVSARHSYDHSTRRRSVEGASDDRLVLADIRMALRQAEIAMPSPELPYSAEEMRRQLGPDFARHFIDRLEAMGIDIVRLEEISTAYSFTDSDRHIIVIKSTGNWFYENWSLAHELGHLCLRHRGILADPANTDPAEIAANAFAADLLLPIEDLDQLGPSVIESAMAEFIWNHGVSTDAVRRRIGKLRAKVPEPTLNMLNKSTQRALRHHWNWVGGDPITERMAAASTRHFPRAWIESHVAKIAEGALHKRTLAWMLGVDPDTLEVEEPADSGPLETENIANILG